ncbi:hypothetical protein PIB30_079609 [Stylosanthes scabra]|uniref:Uncharacterized protein n=1 Tax=Stylosanthes scabra TaxID=79078 RepID=A0ABU6TQR8_9FABA|nr:hypothetical protein [Stylosanthes scabra]
MGAKLVWGPPIFRTSLQKYPNNLCMNNTRLMELESSMDTRLCDACIDSDTLIDRTQQPYTRHVLGIPSNAIILHYHEYCLSVSHPVTHHEVNSPYGSFTFLVSRSSCLVPLRDRGPPTAGMFGTASSSTILSHDHSSS